MSDITELFSRDPLKLTKDDRAKIIEEMRKKRALFNSTPTTKSGSKAAPKKLTADQEAAAQSLKGKLDIKL